MASNPWFVEIPASAQGKPDSYLESVDFITNAWAVGSPQYNALQAGQAISDYGMQMVKWKGPFATEAEARAAQNPQPSPSGPQALTNAVTQGLIPTLFTQRGFAIRLVEGILGIGLIYIGAKAVI